jgi:hypothetical protein
MPVCHTEVRIMSVEEGRIRVREILDDFKVKCHYSLVIHALLKQ